LGRFSWHALFSPWKVLKELTRIRPTFVALHSIFGVRLDQSVTVTFITSCP
jgi:hypothetical protein